jgi:glycosyltransferase involved in cell wall biosynthesis
MKPLVSILIPAYNAEQWLSDTFKSALAQTWEHKEIIVVDDGSKDGTLALARSFESEIVRVFSQQNQGAAAARNKAYSLSRGEYIQWLDADDLLAPEKIARQMQAALDSGNRRMLISGEWATFMHRPAHAKFIPTGLWSDLSKAEWLMRKLEQNAYMQTASWLMSRELCEAAGPWDTRLLGDDDGEYFCRVLLASEAVRFCDGAKVYYRQAGSGSLSYIGDSRKKQDAQWLSMEKHIAYLLSLEDSERARRACVTYLQNWMVFFYPDRTDLLERADKMAERLGGKLHAPQLSWKYSWIRAIFGWRVARNAQLRPQRLRWSMVSYADGLLGRLEPRRQAASLEAVSSATLRS